MKEAADFLITIHGDQYVLLPVSESAMSYLMKNIGTTEPIGLSHQEFSDEIAKIYSLGFIVSV